MKILTKQDIKRFGLAFVLTLLVVSLFGAIAGANFEKNKYVVFGAYGPEQDGTFTGALGEFTTGAVITQVFTTATNTITSVELLFGTYNRVNEGTLEVVLSQNRAALQKWSVDVSELKDNSFHSFKLAAPVLNTHSAHFQIEITCVKGEAGNAVTLWRQTTPTEEDSVLRVGDNRAYGHLIMNVTGDISRVNYLLLGIIGGFVVGMGIVFFSKLSEKSNASNGEKHCNDNNNDKPLPWYSRLSGFVKSHKAEVGYGGILTGLLLCALFFLRNVLVARNVLYYDFAALICTACLVIAAVTLYIVFFTRCKIEVLFLCAFLTLGGVYNLIITPFSVPDENFHWGQTTKFTNAFFLDVKDNYTYIESDANFPGAILHTNNPIAYRNIMAKFFEEDRTIGKTIELSNLENYVPIEGTYLLQYVPQTVGMGIGRVLPNSKIVQFYFGRIFNLAFAAAILYYSIKIIPKRFKKAAFVICLLPMFLQQAASYSSDVFINSLSVLLVSLFLREIFEGGKLSMKRYIAIAVVAVLLAPAKYIYAALMLFVLAIPVSRFAGKRDYLIRTSALAAAVGLATVLSFLLISLESAGVANSEGHQNYPLSYIFTNPIETFVILINTTIVNGSWYLESMFASYLSGMNLFVNNLIVYSFFGVFALCLFNRETDTAPVVIKAKLCSFTVVFTLYFAVLYSMFFGWTSDFRNLVMGIQGRYFIPMLLPAAVLFNNSKLVYKANPEKFIFSAAILLNFLVVFDVIYVTIGIPQLLVR